MGTGRAYGRREQAAGASALVLFIGALYILGVFTPTTPLPGEPRDFMRTLCTVEHVGTSFANMCHFEPRRKAAARRMLADEGVEW